MLQDLIRLIGENLDLIQLRHFAVFLIIIVYAFVMLLFGVTRFRCPIQLSLGRVFVILGKAVLVALVEEILFRCFIYYIVFRGWIGLDAGHAMIFTGLLFAWGHFRWIGVHMRAPYKPELFFGLFLFNMILCRNFPVGNFLFHMFAILGVEVTNAIFEREADRYWWIWDESHALIRSPIIWTILIAYYYIV